MALILMAVTLSACSSASGSSSTEPITATGPKSPQSTPVGSVETGPLGPEGTSLTVDTAGLPADARPTTPRGAVEAFLVTQVTGDSAASYRLLSDADRSSLSESDWDLAQIEIPRHVDFEVTAEQELVDQTGFQVAVSARYQSSLDEVSGLIPARASEVWTVVPGGPGGAEWRIDLGRSTSTPVLPPDADAATMVTAWARTRQDCAVPDEYAGLLGFPTLADRLCDAEGDVRTAGTEGLDVLDDPNPYLNAFGSEAARWGRVVELTGPVELQVVVAPVDDRWLVIGIAPPA